MRSFEDEFVSAVIGMKRGPHFRRAAALSGDRGTAVCRRHTVSMFVRQRSLSSRSIDQSTVLNC
jgi:hypothetical protein